MGLKNLLPEGSQIPKVLGQALAVEPPAAGPNASHISTAIGLIREKKDGARTAMAASKKLFKEAVSTAKATEDTQRNTILLIDGLMKEELFREEFMKNDNMDSILDCVKDPSLLLSLAPTWGRAMTTVRGVYAFNIFHRDICIAFGKPIPTPVELPSPATRGSLDVRGSSDVQRSVTFAIAPTSPPTPPLTPPAHNANPYAYPTRTPSFPSPGTVGYTGRHPAAPPPTLQQVNSGPFSWRPRHALPNESVSWDYWKRKIEEDLIVAEGCVSMLTKAVDLAAKWDKSEDDISYNRLVQVYWKECLAIQKNLPELVGEVEDEELVVRLIEVQEQANRAATHFAQVLAVKRSEADAEARRQEAARRQNSRENSGSSSSSAATSSTSSPPRILPGIVTEPTLINFDEASAGPSFANLDSPKASSPPTSISPKPSASLTAATTIEKPTPASVSRSSNAFKEEDDQPHVDPFGDVHALDAEEAKEGQLDRNEVYKHLYA
ncbi:hypothetical protein HDV00_001232 [Rhizophlyctis rosea]|nr:hypothetical protein HDV00_001232 [Rhizophlyctis rosea]